MNDNQEALDQVVSVFRYEGVEHPEETLVFQGTLEKAYVERDRLQNASLVVGLTMSEMRFGISV